MNPQELLTAPASTLTRKQRKLRAAIKRDIASGFYVAGEADTRDPALELCGRQIHIRTLP